MKYIKSVFSIALLDEKSRRKRTRLLFILTTATLTVFLLVNSLVESLIEGIQNIVYQPYGRVVSIIADTYTYEDEMRKLEEKYGESDEIEQIFWHIYSRSVTWLDSELVGTHTQTVEFVTAVDELEQYLLEGKAKPGQGEILVPKYLYDVGGFGKYSCADGSELLGKTLTFEVKNVYRKDETREYSYKVAGVYDNVNSGTGGASFCINEMDAFELDCFYGYRTEESIREEMETYGIPEEGYENMHWQHAIGFYVSQDYDLQEVMDKIRIDTGKDVHFFVTPAKDIIDYYEFIIFLGNIIVFMLGITAVLVLVISIFRDLRERKGQFALRYAFGYSRGMQFASYVLEKIWILGQSCVAGITVTVVAVLAGNYIIQHIAPFYKRNIDLYLHWNEVFTAVCVVVCGVIFCILVSAPGILGIHPAKTLKKEEGR